MDKKTLIREFCSRLPYGVMVCITEDSTGEEYTCRLVGLDDVYNETYGVLITDIALFGINNEVKLYLRPLSSMTEEEIIDFEEKTKFNYYPGHVIYKDIPAFDNDCTEFSTGPDTDHNYRQIKPEDIIVCINWLESHHFDYNGLIEKGLALEAPEGMYNIK